MNKDYDVKQMHCVQGMHHSVPYIVYSLYYYELWYTIYSRLNISFPANYGTLEEPFEHICD